jgi:hypothetical protein
MGDSTKYFNTFLSKETLLCLVTETSDLFKKVLHKINRVYTPEEYSRLFEQSWRKGSFSITMCNDHFSTEHKHW